MSTLLDSHRALVATLAAEAERELKSWRSQAASYDEATHPELRNYLKNTVTPKREHYERRVADLNALAAYLADVPPWALDLLESQRNTRRELAALHQEVIEQGARTMADMTALGAKVDELSSKISDFEQREAATIAGMQSVIDDLKNQQSQGVDTQPAIDKIQAIIDSIPAAAPTSTDSASTDDTSSSTSDTSGDAASTSTSSATA